MLPRTPFRVNPARISTACGIGKRCATTRGLKQDRIQDDPARTEVRVGVFARRDYFLFAKNYRPIGLKQNLRRKRLIINRIGR